jgi:hypothetical protein
MSSVSTKTALHELRRRLRDLFVLQETGAGHAIVRSRGAIDGYMAALVDTGIVGETALVALVNEERRRWRGPALGTFSPAQEDRVVPSDAGQTLASA